MICLIVNDTKIGNVNWKLQYKVEYCRCLKFDIKLTLVMIYDVVDIFQTANKKCKKCLLSNKKKKSMMSLYIRSPSSFILPLSSIVSSPFMPFLWHILKEVLYLSNSSFKIQKLDIVWNERWIFAPPHPFRIWLVSVCTFFARYFRWSLMMMTKSKKDGLDSWVSNWKWQGWKKESSLRVNPYK